MSVTRSVITGIGGYLPERTVSNEYFTTFLDTSDAWITERTGIEKRHFVAEGQTTSDMAVKAAEIALKAAGKSAADIDLIIVATTTPDMPFPATAALVQQKLGCGPCAAFDVQAVCSGFVYGLSVADGFVSRHQAKCALVIGAEAMSRLLDFDDRATCILFGDGAGAVIIEPKSGEGTPQDRGILGFELGCDGSKIELLYVDGGTFDGDRKIGTIKMQGNAVFKQAVTKISDSIEHALERANLTIAEVDWFVPHQANLRILKGVAQRLGLSEDKVITTVQEHANTSAASIPLAWYHAVSEGKAKQGDVIVIEALGGGLTYGAVTIRL